MQLLVLGANGLLGSNVVAAARTRSWGVVGTYHSTSPALDIERHQLDIRDTEEFAQLLDRHAPDAVVNCAAMTDVDACEERPELARAVNAEAPGTLASACAERDVPFVHVSTDYVYDGTATEPYPESATPSPLQAYGRTKLDGDNAVRSSHDAPLLVRLSFVYGVHRATATLTGFPAWVRDRLAAGDSVPLFTDQHVTPSRAGQAAETMLDLLADGASGTFNVAARSCVTPYAFGAAIARRLDAPTSRLEEGKQSDVDRPAPRPGYTCLDVSKVESTLESDQPTLEADLDAIGDALRPDSYS